MSETGKEHLYSPQLLALAVELADYRFDLKAPLIGEAVSRTCGSEMRLSLASPDAGLGLQAKACAVGQAAAAIFARHALPLSQSRLRSTLAQIERWLAADGPTPDWPDIEMLEPARAYPARHAAILLPWRAALDALSKEAGAG